MGRITFLATTCIPASAETVFDWPLGALGQLLGGPFVRRKLKRLFAYRRAVARRAFERPRRHA